MAMTPREAYEEDVRRYRAAFPDARIRRAGWDNLDDIQRLSWKRNPTPREWKRKTPAPSHSETATD